MSSKAANSYTITLKDSLLQLQSAHCDIYTWRYMTLFKKNLRLQKASIINHKQNNHYPKPGSLWEKKSPLSFPSPGIPEKKRNTSKRINWPRHTYRCELPSTWILLEMLEGIPAAHVGKTWNNFSESTWATGNISKMVFAGIRNCGE